MTSNPDKSSSPGAPSSGEAPIKVIIGRPMRRPGETKEQAARRLAQELFGRLKPNQSEPVPSESGEPPSRDVEIDK